MMGDGIPEMFLSKEREAPPTRKVYYYFTKVLRAKSSFSVWLAENDLPVRTLSTWCKYKYY